MLRLILHLILMAGLLLVSGPAWAQPWGGPLPRILVQADAADSLLAKDVEAMMRAAVRSYRAGELPPDRSPIYVQLAANPERFREMRLEFPKE